MIDPSETQTFLRKAPALYDLGQRAAHEFSHVSCSGAVFLERLRIEFSKTFVRRILQAGTRPYAEYVGTEPDNGWLEPHSDDATVLWHIRRDLEGCGPNEPAKMRQPVVEPLLGMTILQLLARGATFTGRYWHLNGKNIRVIRAANRPLHEVESVFSRDTPPPIAPDVTVAVGAESLSLPASVARGSGIDSIVRGPAPRWLSRSDAIEEFDL